MEWAGAHGLRVLNLQHDGVVIEHREGVTHADTAAALSQHVTQRAGYAVKVECKTATPVQTYLSIPVIVN